MRKMIMLCSLAFCMIASAIFAENSSLSSRCIDGKLYVEPGTVYVAPNGIFINVEGNFVPVSGICIDEGGIYVLGYDCVRMVQ